MAHAKAKGRWPSQGLSMGPLGMCVGKLGHFSSCHPLLSGAPGDITTTYLAWPGGAPRGYGGGHQEVGVARVLLLFPRLRFGGTNGMGQESRCEVSLAVPGGGIWSGACWLEGGGAQDSSGREVGSCPVP